MNFLFRFLRGDCLLLECDPATSITNPQTCCASARVAPLTRCCWVASIIEVDPHQLGGLAYFYSFVGLFFFFLPVILGNGYNEAFLIRPE